MRTGKTRRGIPKGRDTHTAPSVDASELQLRVAERLSRLGAWSVELSGLTFALSDHACAIYDRPPGSAPTLEEVSNACVPEHREAMALAFEACLKDGVAFDLEVQLLTSDARLLWIRSIGEAERDARGVIRRAHGAIQDISDRKRAEEEARRVAERLTTTLESITDAFFTLDSDWRFTFVNLEAERRLAWSREDLIGREIWTMFPGTVGTDFEREYRRAMAEQQTVTFEAHYPPADAWIAVRAYPSGQGLAVHFRDVTATRRVEQDLRESHDKFHHLADNSTDVIWIRSPDMREVLYVSPAFERIWGRSVRVLYDDPHQWADFTVAEDRPRVRAAFATLMADARSIDIEYRIARPDGEIRWIRARGFQVRDASDTLIRLTGIVTDITDRTRAEAALQESEARYRALVQSSFDPIVVTRDGTLLFLNPAALKMLGASSDAELVGRPLLDLVHPDSQTQARERLATAEHGGLLPLSEERFVRLDGTVVDVAIQGTSTIYDNAPAMFSSMRNVTDSKRLAEALRASMEEFRTLAEAMPQMVWVTQPDGRPMYMNQRWTDYTGLTLAESLVSGWQEPLHPDDSQRALSAWAQTTATMAPYSTECRLRRADGAYRWWLIRGVPQRDAAGSVIRWFGTCTDIHDLKQAQLEISRTNRALQMLSSCNDVLIRAAHEQELLDQICRIVVESGGYRMAWVGYAQDDESRSVMPMAFAGVEDGYLSEVKVSWNEHDPLGMGPTGQVIRTGRAAVSSDFTQDPNPAPWLASALRRGYGAAIRLPLRDGERTFGVLGLFSAGQARPGPEELKLLQEMADNLAFGIGSLRAQGERERLQTAVVKVAAGVSAASGREFFEQLARHMADALGADVALVAHLVPGEPALARTIAAVVDGRVTGNIDFTLLDTPCGSLLTTDTWVVPSQAAGHLPPSPWFSALGAHGCVGQRLVGSSGQMLGLVLVLFTRPFGRVEFVTSTLQIFAARAASELERQDTDAQVREQAALLDIAHEAIQVLDLDGRIIYWNKGAERLYGWTAPEALGHNAVELLDRAGPPSEAARATLLAHGEYQEERIRRTRDGRDVTVEVRWTLVRDASDRPKSIFAINTDITEKKRHETHALRAQRMESIGTLAGGIAHDLNNVLAPILMSLDMLKDLVKHEEDSYLLTTLEGSAQRGADLVKQVLSFARGVEGQRITVSPLHIMRDLLKVMLETFPKNINVRFTPARTVWTIKGDPTQMHQVFLNLCVNARDAMPDGGVLTIGMVNETLDDTRGRLDADVRPGPYVVVTVDDTGIGIPADIRDRICEPFFTTKQLGQGTGLGLSTTLAIVKSHGGFIDIHSVVGEGTAFKVYLPADTTAAADEGVPDAARVPHGNGELVLVVDDEDAIRAVAQRTLERYGYRVITAVNGADALAAYARHREEIAVVLTDMAMPIMDGAALVLALREMNPRVRIIASSGLASGSGFTGAIGVGVVCFVPKPYKAETLLTLLKQVLTGEV